MRAGIVFGVLGTVVVRLPSGLVDVGEPRRRAVLGALLVDHGRAVRLDRLIALMWGSRPPQTARKAVQVYVSQLRRSLRGLEGVSLDTDGDGYRLTCSPDHLDLHVFHQLASRAAAEIAPGPRRKLLRDALGLWRGPALADVGDDGLLVRVGEGLDEERLSSLEDLYEAELRLGNEREILRELHLLSHEHPLRERLAGLLMVALQRSGRRIEAAAVFPQLRLSLITETGLEPGRALAALHRSILAGEAVLPPPAPSPPSNRDGTRRDLLDSIGRLSAVHLPSLLEIADGHLRSGDYDRALACYHAARALARDNADEPAMERATRGVAAARAAASPDG